MNTENKANQDKSSLQGGKGLPNFDKWWDFKNPAETESKFRTLLPEAQASGDTAYWAELLTQIARTQGLQQNFDESHATLDLADSLITPEMKRPSVRSLLERGRAINSSGKRQESIARFQEAFELAQQSQLEYYAVDAAHMLGIVHEGAVALNWVVKALALAESTTDLRTRKWRGTLYNNLGWTYHDLSRHQDALRMFEHSLAIETERDNQAFIGIAKWSIAKMYRFLDRVDEALEMQTALLDRPSRKDNPSEGYTREEIGECWLRSGRGTEAAPHFARAWDLLHSDPWLKRDEAERLQRLKPLGGK